jgi:hypothetical protein
MLTPIKQLKNLEVFCELGDAYNWLDVFQPSEVVVKLKSFVTLESNTGLKQSN